MPRSVAALLACLLAAPALAADKVPAERTTNDRLLIDTLAAVHDRGAALFNAGDPAGCYRLFQGALTTARLLLPKDVDEAVDRGLTDAERDPGPAQKAMRLHLVIEDVRKRLRPTAGPSPTQLPPPRKVTTDGVLTGTPSPVDLTGEPPRAPERPTPEPAKAPPAPAKAPESGKEPAKPQPAPVKPPAEPIRIPTEPMKGPDEPPKPPVKIDIPSAAPGKLEMPPANKIDVPPPAPLLKPTPPPKADPPKAGPPPKTGSPPPVIDPGLGPIIIPVPDKK